MFPQKPNILLIEDDVSYRSNLIKGFSHKYDIMVCGNTREVFNMLSTRRDFELVLLDIHLRNQLDDFGGLQLVERIQDALPGIPIIAITGDRNLMTTRTIFKEAGNQIEDIVYKTESNFVAIANVIDKTLRKTKKHLAFLSYSSKDKESVQHITEILDIPLGVIAADRSQMKIGVDVKSHTTEFLYQSKNCIVVLSPHTAEAKYQQLELSAIKDFKFKEGRLIPVILPNTKTDSIPEFIQKLNLIKLSPDKADWENQLLPVTKIIWGNEESNAIVANKIELLTETRVAQLKEAYRLNLQSPALIKSMQCDEYLFFSKWDWRLDPKLNIIIAKNGMGKTVLLRLLALMTAHYDKALDSIFMKPDGTDQLILESQDGKKNMLTSTGGLHGQLGESPILCIGDLRFLPNIENLAITDVDANTYTTLLRGTIKSFVKQEPEQQRFINALSILSDIYFTEERMGKTPNEIFSQSPIFKIIKDVFAALGQPVFEFHEISKQEHTNTEIILKGANGEKFPIGYLSRGTASVLYLIIIIYLHLLSKREARQKQLGERDEHHDSRIPVNEEIGIVIIDEIDAHLHPEWQMALPKLLTEQFPNVQFILATHSPLIISDCRPGQIHTLYLDKKNKIQLGTFPGSTLGASIYDIYQFYLQNRKFPTEFTRLVLEDDRELYRTLTTRYQSLSEQLKRSVYQNQEATEILEELGRIEHQKVKLENWDYRRQINDLKALNEANEEKIAYLNRRLNEK